MNAWPDVSIIVPVYNGEDIIARKLDITLDLEYPTESLQIVVVSDGSTDRTEEIVEGYASRGVQLVRTGNRCGKEEAQKIALKACNAEIFVFTDVGTTTPPESLKKLVLPFSDDQIGATSSEDKFLDEDGRPKGEGIYVRYEMWLRRLESNRATLVGLSGSYFAARRSVCTTWDTEVPSDFNTAIECAENGLFAVSVPGANGVYADVANPSEEYGRKVRTVVRGMRGLIFKRKVLNPLQYGFFSLQMWGHKLTRWLMPWCLLIVFVTSIVLSKSSAFFFAIAVLQAVMYFLAFAPAVVPSLMNFLPLRILYYIGTVNVAIAHAAVQVLSGRKMAAWEPTKRSAG